MKQAIFIILLCITAANGINAQNNNANNTGKISFATTVGTGFSVNKPSSTPFTWQFLGYYKPAAKWSVGMGTGISSYEKILIPVYGDVKYQIGRKRTLTPYVECAAGYSFAPSGKANGGLFLNPSVGVQFPLKNRLKLQLAIGYELQKLERLNTQTDNYFHKEFAERLNHSMISLRFGLAF